MMTRFCLMPK